MKEDYYPNYDGDNTKWLSSRRRNSLESKSTQTQPDARKHQIISFIKSGVRIVACFIGAWGDISSGFLLLAVAEIIGIYEELV
jgi:hypothetical protein